MRKLILPLLIGTTLLATAAANASSDDDHREGRALSIAVFGDSPYGINDADKAQFLATPAFIETINRDKDVSLVFHVGDIHSGKQRCSFAYDQSIYDMWTAFKSPLVYTPGDNEWMDCHKSKEGSQPPLDNLSYVREIFFANPGRALAADKTLITQAQTFDPTYPSDAEYVENVMWSQAGVVFVSVNVPGGSNNGEDNWYGVDRTAAQTAEILKRTAATQRWIDRGFALAKTEHARAVLIQLQADMWDLDGTLAKDMHIANYRQYIDNIAMRTAQFGKPVLLVNGAACLTENGASEVACSNDAYAAHPNGYNVPNFHRLVVHGSTAPMEWIKLQVKPGDSDGRTGANTFGPFSWKRMVQALPPAP